VRMHGCVLMYLCDITHCPTAALCRNEATAARTAACPKIARETWECH
jgi:hypothetical protein